MTEEGLQVSIYAHFSISDPCARICIVNGYLICSFNTNSKIFEVTNAVMTEDSMFMKLVQQQA